MRVAWALLPTLLLCLACGGVLGGDTAEWDELSTAPGAPAGSGGSAATPKPATPSGSQAKAPSSGASQKGKNKGQIQLSTAAGVQLLVDGNPIVFDMVDASYIADVSPGQHHIEVINLLGKTVGQDTVDVQAGKRVRYKYQKKELSKVGVVTATFKEAPPPSTQTQAPQQQAAVASLQFAEMAPPSGHVWVGGREIPYVDASRSYVIGGLQPGQYEVRVEIDRQVLFDGLIEARSGQNHRCIGAWVAFEYRLDCHWTQPAL